MDVRRKGPVLNERFFNRPTLEVARDLMGKHLCRRQGKKTLRLCLTEVEAYDGPEDKACHAHRGRTPRNAIMFGPPGFWYVYLCYGVHWLLNIVVGPENYPAAVLIRGAGDISGPGRLTNALDVGKSFNHRKANPQSDLWIEENGLTVPDCEIARTPRIGIDGVGPPWAGKPYRMVWKPR